MRVLVFAASFVLVLSLLRFDSNSICSLLVFCSSPFVLSHLLFCSTLARSNPVYNYIFDHNTSFGYKVYPPGHACLTHVCHGEELPYVFDSVEPYQTWNAQEAVWCSGFVVFLCSVAAMFWLLLCWLLFVMAFLCCLLPVLVCLICACVDCLLAVNLFRLCVSLDRVRALCCCVAVFDAQFSCCMRGCV